MKIYLSFSLSITDMKTFCNEYSRVLEKPEIPKRERERERKPWLGKTNISGARLFDSGPLFRFVWNALQCCNLGSFLPQLFGRFLISFPATVQFRDSFLLVPRWRLKGNLPEAPVLHKHWRQSKNSTEYSAAFFLFVIGCVYMRKLAPTRVSYRDDFFISYRVYIMTGSFHISLFEGTLHVDKIHVRLKITNQGVRS